MVRYGEDNSRRDSGDGSYRQAGLGELSAYSGINGTGPIGVNSTDCEGNNSDRTDDTSGESLSKILSRLSALEEKYNEYVGAHQSRLEYRLLDSKEKQAEFNQEAVELKSHIYQLLTSE